MQSAESTSLLHILQIGLHSLALALLVTESCPATATTPPLVSRATAGVKTAASALEELHLLWRAEAQGTAQLPGL